MSKLYKSRHNRKLAGVCAGLGNYFEIDPTIIRLLVVAICFVTAFFPVFLAYIIAAIIMPLEPRSKVHKRYKKLYRSQRNKMFGGVLAGIAMFFKRDVVFFRILYVILTVITGFAPLILAYIVAWIIIPQKPSKNIEIEIIEED